jgi:hypothetical protein
MEKPAPTAAQTEYVQNLSIPERAVLRALDFDPRKLPPTAWEVPGGEYRGGPAVTKFLADGVAEVASIGEDPRSPKRYRLTDYGRLVLQALDTLEKR